MTIEAHIRELDSRHHQLDDLIENESRRPGSDTLHIASLKKEKLRLKEQIESLRRSHGRQIEHSNGGAALRKVAPLA